MRFDALSRRVRPPVVRATIAVVYTLLCLALGVSFSTGLPVWAATGAAVFYYALGLALLASYER